ncbi:MAG: PqqD family protein [Gaiellaceae bacterium]
MISETVGGETIIVNLATGHYFNLQGTAVDVWDGIARGDSRDAIVAFLAASYAAAGGEIEEAVGSLLDDLTAAELVTLEAENGAAPVAIERPPGGQQLPPFTPPTFTTFTDMQDIILLDPVHEVDARGWPHAPTGA